MKLKFFQGLFLFLFIAAANTAQISGNLDMPTRIILNLTEDPGAGMAVTWRTRNEYGNSFAKIAEAKDWIDFEKAAKSFVPRIQSVKLNTGEIVFHYSTLFFGLKPNTLYAYQVGHDSVTSEWSQFKTADNKNSPFEFLYFGDPQNEIKPMVSRIFREAYKAEPNAVFWLITGDLTTEPSLDNLWDEFFYATGFIPRSTPLMPVVGNHKYRGLIYYSDYDKSESKKKVLTPLWRPHFTLPENGVNSLKETSYYFDYQGARFIVLNGMDKVDEQLPWLEKLLSNNPNQWTIVAIHQPLYSTAKERDNKEFKEKLLPLYDKYSVDLVLQGHDHTYGRTYKLRNGKKVNAGNKGTVYAVSVSGPKAYPLNNLNKNLMAKIGEKVQLYQSITIKDNKLNYKSFTATGMLFDSFELIK